MAKTITEDLRFQKIHSVKDLKDANITTLDEETVWLGATPTSILSHIRKIVEKLKAVSDSGGLAEAESDPVFQAWLSTFVAAVEKSYLSLTDTPDSYVGKAKNVPIVNDAENAIDFAETIQALLTHMQDFPASYIGHTLKALRVKADESGVEFYTPVSGVSGTFTTADSKTITVTNGLITSIV